MSILPIYSRVSDMELPDSFKQSMKELLGGEYERFIASYYDPPSASLRVNTSKVSLSEFERIAPFPITKIPFISNGYYTDDTDAWSKHPYYYAGLYYLQEASAMLPAETLPVQKGDVILDLCAAPGGKSTQLCLTREALLVSNDISRSRTIPLVKNLERFGTGNFIVTCESPDKLASVWAETFDCILVDAPCSGEGMFRKDQNLIDAYEKNGPEHYAPIQSQILENAYKMLKGGGKLLYSTCTFSDIEDEQVIISFLSGHPDLSVVDIEKKFGLCGPYMRYSDNPEISGIVHALPHMFKGEGHFMALIRKDGCGFSRCSGNADTQTYSDIVNIFGDMADHFSDGFTETLSKKRFYTSKDGFIYMLPDGFDEMFDKSIRYSRTGICMGYMSKGGKFIPHTAFALAMKYEDYENRLCLDADDPLVIKYLKGETLLIGEGEQNILEKGTVLICAGAYPLGFAAYDGIKLKNLFEKGWIYR